MSGAELAASPEAGAETPRRAWLTVALCCLAAIAEGFDIQSMGVAAPGMAPALHLTRDQLGPAFSASTVGLLVGAVMIGALADRVGRKWALIGSLGVFGALTLATPFARDVNTLLAIRLAAGLGLGGAMPNFLALSAEAVSEARRAQFVAISAAAMPLGGAVASAVAAALPWRAIFVVGGAWPLALVAAMAAALPESARFLSARAQTARTRAARIGPVEALFGGGRGVATLLLWTAAFCVLLCLYLLLNWLPLLLAAKGVTKPGASLVQLTFNIGAVVGTLALALLFRRQRRAGALAGWFVGMAAGAVLLALTPPALATVGLAGFVAGWFISSAPTSLYALAPDFYDVEIRGAGMGAMIGIGRLGAIIGPLFAGALLARGFGTDGVLLALLPFVAAGALATFLVLPRRPAHTD